MSSGNSQLWARLFVVTVAIVTLLFLGLLNGQLQMIWRDDPSRVSLIICGVFLVPLYLAFRFARMIDAASDNLMHGDREQFKDEFELAEWELENGVMQLEERIDAKLDWLNFFTWALPIGGLIGTVIGLKSALDMSSFGEFDSIADIVDDFFKQVTGGASVAFNTTLIGMVCALWNTLNLQIIKGAKADLVDHFIMAASRHRREKGLRGRGRSRRRGNKQSQDSGDATNAEGSSETTADTPNAASSKKGGSS